MCPCLVHLPTNCSFSFNKRLGRGQGSLSGLFYLYLIIIFNDKYKEEVPVEEESLTISLADSVNQRVGFLQDTVAPGRKVVFCLKGLKSSDVSDN